MREHNVLYIITPSHVKTQGQQETKERIETRNREETIKP